MFLLLRQASKRQEQIVPICSTTCSLLRKPPNRGAISKQAVAVAAIRFSALNRFLTFRKYWIFYQRALINSEAILTLEPQSGQDSFDTILPTRANRLYGAQYKRLKS
jgi:hypothetical protein